MTRELTRWAALPRDGGAAAVRLTQRVLPQQPLGFAILDEQVAGENLAVADELCETGEKDDRRVSERSGSVDRTARTACEFGERAFRWAGLPSRLARESRTGRASRWRDAWQGEDRFEVALSQSESRHRAGESGPTSLSMSESQTSWLWSGTLTLSRSARAVIGWDPPATPLALVPDEAARGVNNSDSGVSSSPSIVHGLSR